MFGRLHIWQRRSVFKGLGAKTCRFFRRRRLPGPGQGIESAAQSWALGNENQAQGNEK
jgi:hypothetical protein